VPRLRRPLAVLAALLASATLAACGKHLDEDARVVRAETEGIYLPVGELKYQVQGSRQLNPHDVQDRALLAGIPAEERELGDDEVWFGVFMRVENETHEALPPARKIKIVDTQDDEFEPIHLDDTNPFAYHSTEPVPPESVLPAPDSPAYDTPVRGELILFKLTLEALANRPLELEIESRTLPPQTGIIDLDV
jgi:hypothetical protein